MHTFGPKPHLLTKYHIGSTYVIHCIWPLLAFDLHEGYSHPKLAYAALPTKFGSIVYHIWLLMRGGGVLTDKWYTGMLKGFEVHFHKFWYIDGWVIVTYPMQPICKIGCILENLAKQDGSRTKRLAS